MDGKLKRILDPKMWEMPEDYKEVCRQHIRDCHEKHQSGMLTYEDAEPVQVHAPRVDMMPLPRPIPQAVMRPQAELLLDKEDLERLRGLVEDMKDNTETAGPCKRATVLARGHRIRNADGTVTDVSNDPDYECK